MKYHTIAAVVAAVAVPAFAQVPLYGQCKLLYVHRCCVVNL